VSALCSIIGFGIGFFNLEESNPNIIASKPHSEQTALLKRADENAAKNTVSKSGSMRHITAVSYGVIAVYS
jgi:hypothetical protein